ncbi:hypothetical protein [Nonomuraea polychroma]|nr:hypothetical protein [Nonomuraea polychroma]
MVFAAADQSSGQVKRHFQVIHDSLSDGHDKIGGFREVTDARTERHQK